MRRFQRHEEARMSRWTWALAVLVFGTGCTESPKQAPAPRAEIRSLGGSTVEVLPTAGQFPYCLMYTISERGVMRQLTMTRENRSIKCETGKPIANTSFRIPANEGKVKAYVIFSNERIPAGPVTQQLYELKGRERISALDMRLPGRVFVEMLEFAPREEGTPVTGGVIDSAGEVPPPPTESTASQPEGSAPAAGGAPTASDAVK
jgi:hypothetical protein